MKSALTRLFLKLPGCEIDLDAREFDSTTVDFEFENVSFWIKFVKKLTVFSISNFFIFRFQIFRKPLSMNSGQENQTCTGTSRCVIVGQKANGYLQFGGFCPEIILDQFIGFEFSAYG